MEFKNAWNNDYIVIIIIDRIQYLKLCVKYLLVEDTITEKKCKNITKKNKCKCNFWTDRKKKESNLKWSVR